MIEEFCGILVISQLYFNNFFDQKKQLKLKLSTLPCGKRWVNYVIGFVTLFLSLGENLFGLLARGDWESQFVAMHSDDMLFTVPFLRLISPENFTSALIIHVALIPFVLVVLIGVHVTLVKLQGIARPL